MTPDVEMIIQAILVEIWNQFWFYSYFSLLLHCDNAWKQLIVEAAS